MAKRHKYKSSFAADSPEFANAEAQIRETLPNSLILIAASRFWIMGYILGLVRVVYSDAVDTQAVTLGPDRLPLLLLNPLYCAKLQAAGEYNMRFVLMHEASHLTAEHLHTRMAGRNPEIWTLATECWINNRVQLMMGSGNSGSKTSRGPMPSIKDVDENGNEVLLEQGVNPKTVYEKYKKDLAGQGVTPVSFDDFLHTDEACYRELCRMAKPPVDMNNSAGCEHGPSDGDGQGNLPMDQEAVDQVVGDMLSHAVKAALAGNENAKNELLDLADHTEGENAVKAMGKLGLEALRGNQIELRKPVDYWAHHVESKMASLLEQAYKPQINHRVSAIDMITGRDPQIVLRGNKPVRRVLICIDTSGSMPDTLLKFFEDKIGREDGVEAEYVTFDVQVHQLNNGGHMVGGGGTDLHQLVEYAESPDTPYDAVVVVTDAFVDAVHPQEPDKWIFLVTPGGSKRLEEQMAEVDFFYLS